MNKKFFTFLTTAALLLTNATPFAATENSDEIEYFHPSDSVLTSAVVVSEDNASAYSWGNNDDLTVNVSINSDINQEISSFEITDVNGIGNESVIAQDGQSVEISGLAENELYVFESVLVSENTSSSVRGGIEIVEDEQGELVAVTDIYDFSDLEMIAAYDSAGIMPLSSGSVTLYTETNDTGSFDYNLHEYAIMKGIIHSQNDMDSYKMVVDNSGIVDFKLLVPENSGINLMMTIYKYNSGTYTTIGRSANSGTSDEFFRIANASAGDIYRIQIDTVSGSSGNYYLQFENNPAKAWFPQAVGKISSTYYWNTNNLDNLYYNNNDSNVFTNNQSGGTDKMSSGCSMAAYAMVLANMNAQTTTEKYDFRLTNETSPIVQYYKGKLSPDPYTVFLVNNDIDGTLEYRNSKYYLSTNNTYTMSAAWNNIATRFGVEVGDKITLNEVPDDDLLSGNYDVSIDSYSGMIDKLNVLYNINPSYYDHGVLMRFVLKETNNLIHGHTIVVTIESGTYKVYDPGQSANTEYCGKDIQLYFSQNPKGYTYENIWWIRGIKY